MHCQKIGLASFEFTLRSFYTKLNNICLDRLRIRLVYAHDEQSRLLDMGLEIRSKTTEFA